MSAPTIPSVQQISLQNAVAAGIVSIALEEIALAHIINAEGEKIQKVSAILECPAEIIEFQKSVARVLQTVLKSQMLLQFKLENLEEFLASIDCCPQQHC